MPAQTAWIVALIIVPVAGFLACTRPLLLFLAPAWMAVEFISARSQVKPFWPRMVMAAIAGGATAYVALRMIFP